MNDLTMRLREQFDAQYEITEDGCWLWTGPQFNNSRGHPYGRMRIMGGSIRAHQLSYELLVGPILDGLEIDHLCKNCLCVNPSHLEPVTHRENVLRGDGFAARNARKTHCPKGHPYDENNTMISNGGRDCRECGRTRNRQRQARRRRADGILVRPIGPNSKKFMEIRV